MSEIIRLFEQYGLASVFLGVLIEQLGAPVPALPFLLLAGARGALDGIFALKALGAATIASVIADTAWFLVGRRYGRPVLGLLCRVSISPSTCVQKSEMSFSRRGILTVLFAKFIPGVSTLAPPMAGALHMRLATFVLADLAGTILWASSGLAAGLLLHDQLNRVISTLEDLGSTALVLLTSALALYVAWRLVYRFAVHRRLRAPARITPQELARRINGRERLAIVDVRPADAFSLPRIAGAMRASLSDLPGELARLPNDVRLVTYCDCPNDASAARAARALARHGYEVHVLAGGFAAWVAAGLPVDGRDAGAIGEATRPCWTLTHG